MSLIPKSFLLKLPFTDKPAIEPPLDLSACDLPTRKVVLQQFEEIVSIELARAGYVPHLDGGMLCNLSEILNAHLRRQRVWRSMTLTRIMSFDGPLQPVNSCWFAFRNGVLAIGSKHPYSVPFDHFGEDVFSEVDIYYTRSKDVAKQHRHYKLPNPCTGLEIDPAQDLLVAWYSPKPLPWHSLDNHEVHDEWRSIIGSRVNFFYLPNGQHHRLASKSGLSDHSKEYYDEYGVKIWGDHIALIDRCCESIDVYNWKRNGELMYSLGKVDCMLNDFCLLKPCGTYNNEPLGGGSASFDVFAKSEDVEHLVARFQLPMLRDHVKCKISQCETFRTNYYSAKSGSKDAPPILLSTSPTPSMIQLRLVVCDVTKEHNRAEYVVFVYTRLFLLAISKLGSVGDQAAHEVNIIPWEQWGPRSSFWFEEGSYVGSLLQEELGPDTEDKKHEWKNACYGFRVLLPSQMLDFTPLDADDCEDHQTHGQGDIHLETVADEKAIWFTKTVRTTAAYRQSNTENTSLGGNYVWYIVDEDVLGISKETEQPYSVDVLTAGDVTASLSQDLGHMSITD